MHDGVHEKGRQGHAGHQAGQQDARFCAEPAPGRQHIAHQAHDDEPENAAQRVQKNHEAPKAVVRMGRGGGVRRFAGEGIFCAQKVPFLRTPILPTVYLSWKTRRSSPPETDRPRGATCRFCRRSGNFVTGGRATALWAPGRSDVRFPCSARRWLRNSPGRRSAAARGRGCPFCAA